MKRTFFLIQLATLLCISFTSSYSQVVLEQLHVPDSGFVQVITTNGGNTFIGKIISVMDEEIEFETEVGILKIKISNIKEIKEHSLSVIKGDEFWFPDPNSSRLYFAPKGKMLKKGEGYYQNIWVIFSSVSYGFTDNITVGVGTIILPNVPFYYITPKVGIAATENFDFAVGALIIKIPDHTAGILYGVGTYSGNDFDFTLGLGYGFADDNLAEKPMITLGFEKRLSRRTAFISENWVFPGVDDPILSYGIRFFGESMAVDVAFYNTISGIQFPGIPYLDFTYNF